MKKIVFVGCSFTAGTGWNDKNSKKEAKDSPYLWVNLCHQKINQLNKFELINLGVGGASNTEIFENSVKAITDYKQNIDTLFVQWTSVPRYNFTAGFELWDTSVGFSRYNDRDINLHNGDQWPRDYVNNLVNKLVVLHHDHWEIVKIVRYTHILSQLTKILGIRIIFINGICPWDSDYFAKLDDSAKPEEYTEFTKTKILDIENRDDSDIQKLYNLAHKHYDEVGGITPCHWVNLYQSQKNTQIDTNYDKKHPGINSNHLYFQQVKTFLES
jgi:hypothetical protein